MPKACLDGSAHFEHFWSLIKVKHEYYYNIDKNTILLIIFETCILKII